jgi:hypothetical protein
VTAIKWVTDHWAMMMQSVGALAACLAAVTGSLALWFNAMPWCDVADVDASHEDGGVTVTSRVRNAGRGQAFEVKLCLLEYGRVPDLEHSEGYLGPLAPSQEITYKSARIGLEGRTPQDTSFRVLLTWNALLWTYGESYVEERYGEQPRRPRIKVVYPWNRLWRRITGYNRTGRH